MKRKAGTFGRDDSRGTGRNAPASIASATARRAERARVHLAERRRRERKKMKTDRLRRTGPGTPGLPESILKLALWVPAALALAIGIHFTSPIQHWMFGAEQHIARISVSGARNLTPDAIAAATGIVPGAAILAIDVAEVAARLEDEPLIRSARALLLPEGTLIIAVEERVPVAIWLGSEDDHETVDNQLVDRDGHIFASACGFEDAGLLRLVGGGRATAESEADRVQAVALGRRIDAFGHPSTGAYLLHLPSGATGEGFVLEFSSPKRRVILGREHLSERLDRLERLLRSREPSVTAATVIDLRFADRAVLRAASAG